MLQSASTDLFNPLVPKAHTSGCQNLIFPLQIKPVKVNFMLNWWILIFCTLGPNGLIVQMGCRVSWQDRMAILGRISPIFRSFSADGTPSAVFPPTCLQILPISANFPPISA